jgi:hypothetical protein
MQIRSMYVDMRNMASAIDSSEGLVLKDCTLVTSRTDSYDTVILPSGCVGPESNTVIDTDHLFQPTRAYIKNRRVVQESSDETALIADIVIPKNSLRYWKDGQGKIRSESMIEAIKRGDLTGLSVNFDKKPYSEFVYENDSGRKMFARYTLPFISLLFGKPQGQQFARVGKEIDLSQEEMQAYSRAFNTQIKSYPITSNLRCLCNEYLASEDSADLISEKGENITVAITDPLWDELEAVDKSSIQIKPELDLETNNKNMTINDTKSNKRENDTTENVDIENTNPIENSGDQVEKLSTETKVDEMKEANEVESEKIDATTEAKEAEVKKEDPEAIAIEIEEELRACKVCDATRKVIMDKIMKGQKPYNYSYNKRATIEGTDTVNLDSLNSVDPSSSANTNGDTSNVDSNQSVEDINNSQLIIDMLEDLRTSNEDMRILKNTMDDMIQKMTTLVEKTSPIIEQADQQAITDSVTETVMRKFETYKGEIADKRDIKAIKLQPYT